MRIQKEYQQNSHNLSSKEFQRNIMNKNGVNLRQQKNKMSHFKNLQNKYR
jgi:hypothetical protein